MYIISNYYSPTEIVFGKDTLKEVGRCIKKYSGTKVLVVYGSKRVKRKKDCWMKFVLY